MPKISFRIALAHILSCDNMAWNKIVKLGVWPLLFIFFTNFQPSHGKTSSHPIVVVVSLDGFRNDYFSDVQQTPSLDALGKSGVTVPYMEPVFPTKTFPNHQSIATGLYPETHGVVDNTVWEPRLKKRLSGFKRDKGFWNYDPQVLPIWIRNEMGGKGRVSACIKWPGSNQSYGKGNNLLPTHHHSGTGVGWRDRVNKVISWLTHSSKPANLAFLYYHEPDETGHALGPNDPKTKGQVRSADKRIAYLVSKLKEAGIFHKVNMIVLSDHGMKEVSRKQVINMKRLIDRNLVETQHGGTPVLQLKPKRGKEKELYRKLKEHSRHHNFTIYKKAELQDYPWNYSKSRRILDYVVVADSGWVFDGDIYAKMESWDKKRTSEELKVPLAERKYGVHGYPNWNRSMRAFFMASGPAFKKGWIGKKPIRNVDVVPLISKILKLEDGIPHNGSWERVKDMIRPGYL